MIVLYFSQHSWIVSLTGLKEKSGRAFNILLLSNCTTCLAVSAVSLVSSGSSPGDFDRMDAEPIVVQDFEEHLEK